MSYTQPLTELNSSHLNLAGGKAANLGALIHAGLPVPPGFCVTTLAYTAFVDANRLQPEILRQLQIADPANPASLDQVSAAIRALFDAGQIPAPIAAEIRDAYTRLADPQPAVAVRSSATAEDLPDMSFAGQQDTYLNILGEAAVLEAVKRCWASLWTARAIGYRARNLIPPEGVALAVVVQQMIDSQASGVLFTANPLTGRRNETVIDATFGLGEALVSGQVDPDHYVVDILHQQILSKTLGAKALSIHSQPGGGTLTRPETAAAQQQALPDAQILELARFGQRAADFFQSPQDMEWAYAGGTLYVVQSRPITSLYPLPANVGHGDLLALFSLGAVQGMLDPFTPLGSDIFRQMMVEFSRLFSRRLTLDTQRGMFEAGSRLFMNFTPLFRKPQGHAFLRVYTEAIEPGSQSALDTLLADSRLALQPGRMQLRTRLGFARLLLPLIANVLANLAAPTHGRLRLQRSIESLVEHINARHATVKTLSERLAAVEAVIQRMPPLFASRLVPAVACGQVPLQILLRFLCADLPDGPQTVLELTRGLPYNVTTEMDLVLWAVSRQIQADPVSLQHFASSDAPALASDYLRSALPPVAQTAIAAFMQRYGMRGVGEIDMGRPRWNEDPTSLFQALTSYLQIPDSASSPEAIFQRGAAAAEAAKTRLLAQLEQTPRGKIKARLARFLIRRVRELTGLRESPKLAAIRAMTAQRQGLLTSGRELVAAGLLDQPEDIFFLRLADLHLMAAGETRDWKALVTANRETYQREKRRRRIPRVLLSDGTAFYEGMRADAAADPGAILGSPVSPGIVEGIVHIVLDPHGAQLAPGEILVCPGTDPAWTPLFLAAGGLVMEVGGMMTHGSVVAREYGIPAVVGVDQATTRLQTGQRIRVDGTTGHILILEATS